MSRDTAVIIGAGPAGLTAAYEVATRTDLKPVVLESTRDIGGISKTVAYKGNRIDIGGHRFFSKSDRVVDWWRNILPLQGAPASDDLELGRDVPLSTEPGAPDPERTDRVMLVRNRLSRVFFGGRFFDYPISLNRNTFINLGLPRMIKIALSYVKVRFFPIRDVRNLEDFFINRFGRELYGTFFRDYTEKVWGVPCNRISPEWGAQRIARLSVMRAVLDAAQNLFRGSGSIAQKNVETTLIRRFMYPKLGPGQLWEEVARLTEERGGEVRMGHRVVGFNREGHRIVEVIARDEATGKTVTERCACVLSSMPVRELVAGLGPDVPEPVREVAAGLEYRDFMTVGLLLTKLKMENKSGIKTVNDIVPDNWIYIQETGVKLARLQIFNNWSPYMVKDRNTVWLGLEYFCGEGDDLWTQPDEDFTEFAIGELVKIGFIEREDVLDSVVIRMPKAYPAYFGTYDRFDTVKEFLSRLDNLFLIGRNGMHRYGNQDYVMLTAMAAVDAILQGVRAKDAVWNVSPGEQSDERGSQLDTTSDAFRG